MTIKKRLFISNILMMVIPVIVALGTYMILFIILNSILHGELFEMIIANKEARKLEGLESMYSTQMALLGFLSIAGMITIIYFTNRFLTKFVFTKVAQPLEVLSDGVHQIRDGNLDHRINYDAEDEFKPICEDFNEMAVRLSDMVNARQKDETNRRELIAGISHDLRTPLTSIKAYLEGLEKGVASTPETQKRYLDTIKSKTNDLEYIINQLFTFSKLDVGDFPFHPEVIDIGQELDGFVACHEKEYDEKGLKLLLIQNVENVCVKIDVVQFRNVIYNILENSVKYKGAEHVETKITCREDRDNVIIILMDNGPGVLKEALTKMFDVFYRSDESRNDPSKGSGLGLAISKRIIERLGGTIKADNIPESGLAIEISLPKYGGEK